MDNHDIKLELMYGSLGGLLIKIKNEVGLSASTELSNRISLAIEIHKNLLSDFEPAILEVQKIASKRWHFFYADGRHKIREDWHFKQEIESSIIKPEQSQNYRNLLVVLNDIAEKLNVEEFDENIEKMIEVIKFYHHLPIEWNGLIVDVMEVRKEFNRLFDELPDDLLKSKYQNYQELVNKGFSAKDIIKTAREDGKNDHEIFPLIRTLFDLSIEETAKQIRVFVK
jgi:hypothetical protein